MIRLEVCANSVTSGAAAEKGGASRIELCDNLQEGGTTPSAGQILLAIKTLKIPSYPIIRPRGGDFLYSDLEFEVMKADVEFCVKAGCPGVVIGILKADGTVDKERCEELVSIAKKGGLEVTFHRAFDMCADLDQALEDIIKLGCDHILTSGGRATAIEGAETIAHLIKKAAGRISIMPGGGINESNISDLLKTTNAQEFHSSLRSATPSQMEFKNEKIAMGSYAKEFIIENTDVEKVERILSIANTGK